MRVYFRYRCFAFILFIGLAVWLIPEQTVFATDIESEQPPYKHLDENQIYHHAERDEVFITNILDEDDIVECIPFGGECYGMDKYHQNTGPPIEFEIEIDRYFGPVDSEGKLKHPDNIDGGTVQLTLRAYDVDTDFETGSVWYGGEIVYPEVDEIYINDHPEPIGVLRGYDGQWSLTTIEIPVEYIRFPDLDAAGYVVPSTNTIKINVDVANSRFIWQTAVERGWFTIKGVRPVVLVHGFLSSEDTWVEWTKPGGYVEEYGIPMHTFSFPNNHQDWSINAYLLGEQLFIARDRFGVSKLNVIGHSKGGLDTRGYLHLKRFNDDVDNLIMLGTPNGGSPLASLGTTLAMISSRLDFVATSIAEPALTQLTIGYMANTFNQIVQENPQVDYYVIPGFCCTTILVGQSDKIVPVLSVLKLPYAEELGLTEDDHFTLTKNREVFDIVIDKLGIRSHSRGMRAFGTNATSEEITFQMGDGGTAEVSVGETNEHSFRLQADSAPQLVIMTETPVAVTVHNPSHEEMAITTESFFETEENEELFPRMEVTITEPIAAGTWTLTVSHLGESDAPAKYGWMVADQGGPVLHAEPTPVISAARETTTIMATVEGVSLDEAEELNVQAVIRLPNGSMAADSVELTHKGDGTYEGEFIPDHNEPGTYLVLVTAENDHFMRRQLSVFSRLSGSERLPASYTAEGIDSDSDGLFDWLNIEVPLQISQSGTYMVNADLYDRHNNYIGSAMTEADLTADASTVVLQLSGLELAASRFTDDLILKNVQLHSLTSPRLIDWQQGEATIFSSFHWEQFQRPPISVLEGIDDVGILDEEEEGKLQRLSISVPVHVQREAYYIYNARLVDSDGKEVDRVGGYYVDPILLTEGDNLLTLDFDGEFIRKNGKSGPYFVKDFTLEEYYYFDEDDLDHAGVYSLVIANLHETQFYNVDDFVPPREPTELTLTYVDSSVRIDRQIRIDGRVTDRSGEGVGGVAVTFSIDDGEPLVEAITFSGRDWRAEGSFTVYIQPSALGAITLTATISDTDIRTSKNINVVPVPANQLVFGVQPEDATVGQILDPVQVYLVDEYDQPTADSGNVTLRITGDNVRLEGTTRVSAVEGIATFNDLRIFTPGTYTLTAQAQFNRQTRTSESESFTVIPFSHSDEVHGVTVDMNPLPVVAGNEATVSGQVFDSANQGVAGVIVEFFSDDVTEITSAVTDHDGYYETSFIQEKAGISQLIVTIQDTIVSETIAYEVTPSAAYRVVFTVQPEHSIASQPIHLLEARVVDRYGNYVSEETNISVRIQSSSNGAASLQGTTTVTSNSDGVATFNDLTIDQPGRFRLQVQASQSSLLSSTSEYFAVVPAADLKMTLEVDVEEMSSIEAGTRVIFSGKVTDEDDNVYIGLPIEFSANIGEAHPVVVTDQEGKFTTPSHVFYRLVTAGEIEITATVQGTNTKETIIFNVTPSSTTRIIYVKQPEDGLANQIMDPVQVQLLDRFNNPTNEEHELTAYFFENGYRVHESETVTAIDGIAIFENLSIDTPGTYTLMVIIPFGTPVSTASEPFLIAPADTALPADVITLHISTHEIIAGQAVTISGQVLDGESNGLSGVTVEFSVEGEASVPAQVITDEHGTYTTSLLPTRAGSIQLVANVLDTDISESASIEVLPAPAAKLIFATQPLDTIAGEALNVVHIRLFDSYDNPTRAALDVTLSLTDGSLLGDLEGTTTVTAVEGVASFGDLHIDTAGTYTLTAEASGIDRAQSEEFTIEAKPSDEEPSDEEPADELPEEGSSFADYLIITQPTESILYSNHFQITGKVATDSTVTASVYSDENEIVLPAFLVHVTATDDEVSDWASDMNQPLAPGAYQLRITAERTMDGVTESATKVHDFIIAPLTLTEVAVHEHTPDHAVLTFNQHVDLSLSAEHFAGLTLDSRQVVAVESVQGAIVTVKLDEKIGAADPLVVTTVGGTTNVYALGNPLNTLASIAEHGQTGIAKDNGIIPFMLVSVYTEEGYLNLVFNKPVYDAATLHGLTFGGQPLEGAHSISGNTMTVTLLAEPASNVLSYDPVQGNITEMANMNNPLSELLPGLDLGASLSYVNPNGQLVNADIRLNNGSGQLELAPAFDPSHAGVYEAVVPNEVEHVSLDPAPPAGTFVNISFNGVEMIPEAWGQLPLDIGRNTIIIEVVDQGNPHVVLGQYKVALTRASKSSEETLPTSESPSDPEIPVLPEPTPGLPAPPTEIIEDEEIAEEATEETADEITEEIDPIDFATLAIERTKHSDGTLTDQVTLDEEVAGTLMGRAREMRETVIRIAIPDAEDEVSEVKVDISVAASQMIAESGMELEIYTDNAIIRLIGSSLVGIDDDFYFRFVPLKDSLEHAEIEGRANIEPIVRNIAGDEQIELVARPMKIETNLPPNRQVTLVLPLSDVELPEEPAERSAFLAKLGIFIEHSDGDKEIVSGTVASYAGELLGLEFTVSKFSTFSILRFGNPEFGTHSAYITGFPDGEFRPDESLTRGQMAIMIARNLGFDVRTMVDESPFEDVSTDHYAASAIAFIHAQGIISGYPDGQFRADQAITRAEMAMIIAHYLNLITPEGEQPTFDDTAGHWAEAAIEANFAAGIVVGYADGSFRPEQHVTRAEAVVIVNKMFNRGTLQGGVHVPMFPDVTETHWAYDHIQEAAIDHDYVIDMRRKEQWIF